MTEPAKHSHMLNTPRRFIQSRWPTSSCVVCVCVCVCICSEDAVKDHETKGWGGETLTALGLACIALDQKAAAAPPCLALPLSGLSAHPLPAASDASCQFSRILSPGGPNLCQPGSLSSSHTDARSKRIDTHTQAGSRHFSLWGKNVLHCVAPDSALGGVGDHVCATVWA